MRRFQVQLLEILQRQRAWLGSCKRREAQRISPWLIILNPLPGICTDVKRITVEDRRRRWVPDMGLAALNMLQTHRWLSPWRPDHFQRWSLSLLWSSTACTPLRAGHQKHLVLCWGGSRGSALTYSMMPEAMATQFCSKG